MIVIIGSHSQTTKAIDMDSEFRGAFYQIFLVGAARTAIEQPHRNTSLKPQQLQWIRETAYPAMLLANSQYSLIKHPTHGDYEEYRDEGNYPENLEDWDIHDLTITVSNLVDSEFVKTQSPTHDEPKLTGTPTQLHNEPIQRNINSSGLQPNPKTPQKSAKKGGIEENLGSTQSKSCELLETQGSGFLDEPNPTQHEASLIITNNHEPISTVIKKVWGLSPSKSPEYLHRKAQVEAFRKQSKGA